MLGTKSFWKLSKGKGDGFILTALEKLHLEQLKSWWGNITLIKKKNPRQQMQAEQQSWNTSTLQALVGEFRQRPRLPGPSGVAGGDFLRMEQAGKAFPQQSYHHRGERQAVPRDWLQQESLWRGLVLSNQLLGGGGPGEGVSPVQHEPGAPWLQHARVRAHQWNVSNPHLDRLTIDRAFVWDNRQHWNAD